MTEMTEDETAIAGWLEKVAIARLEELLVGLKAGKFFINHYQLTQPYSLQARNPFTVITVELVSDANRTLLTAKARAFNQETRRRAEEILKMIPKEDE